MMTMKQKHFVDEIKKRGVEVKDTGTIPDRTYHLFLGDENVGCINPETGDACVVYRFPGSKGDHAPGASHEEAIKAFETLFPRTAKLITTRGNKPKQNKYYVVILDENLALFACLRLKLWERE